MLLADRKIDRRRCFSSVKFALKDIVKTAKGLAEAEDPSLGTRAESRSGETVCVPTCSGGVALSEGEQAEFDRGFRAGTRWLLVPAVLIGLFVLLLS